MEQGELLMENFNNRRTKTSRKRQVNRAKIVFGVGLVILAFFTIRLFLLQLAAGEDYRAAAYAQRRKKVRTSPKRGTISDRNHKPLAISVTVTSAYIFPEEIKEKDKEEAAKTLSYILGLEQSKLLEIINSKKHSVRIKTKLSEAEINNLKSSGLRCYSIEYEAKRFYPNNDLLSQSLGYINDEGVGIYGVESQYDSLLRGTSGANIFTGSLSGGPIPTEEGKTYDSKDGQNLNLTVDLEAQKILHEELSKGMKQYDAESITGIIMNPQNGEIIAMENFPNFNPNSPNEPTTAQDLTKWDSISEKDKLRLLFSRWKNPSVSNLYEPGSVFKTLTTAIALETKSIETEKKNLHCDGYIQVAPNTVIHCSNRKHPHGDETIKEALKNSCNTAFVQIAWLIGPEKLDSYLRSLHLGDKTGVDLPAEAVSMFPKTLSEMDRTKFATISYGHGISLTPLQMLTAANACINGGIYNKPHLFLQSESPDNKLLYKYNNSDNSRVFSEETSTIVKDYLANSAIESIKEISGFRVGGKSGTSLVAEDGKYTEKVQTSYFAFYPVEKPKYSILVLVNNPKNERFGATVAGPIVSKILERWIAIDKTSVDLKPSETKSGLVPNLKGLTVKEAMEICEKNQIKIDIYGAMNQYTIINKQNPEADQVISRDMTIKVEPDEKSSYKVPDLKGLDKEEVEKVLKDTGIETVLHGIGKVNKQEPESGSIIEGKSSIVLFFK